MVFSYTYIYAYTRACARTRKEIKIFNICKIKNIIVLMKMYFQL